MTPKSTEMMELELAYDEAEGGVAVRSSALLGANPNDVVYTPDWCAKDIVDWFKPSGSILEPCRGAGAFMRYLPPETQWCEIQEGRDFYDWQKRVEWIVSNPPFMQIPKWLRHSFRIADNIVYLIPARSIFFGPKLIKDIYDFGGIKHMRHYGGGGKLNFPMGNAVAAVHFLRGWSGDMGVSHCA
jgi:hypothetical protein